MFYNFKWVDETHRSLVHEWLSSPHVAQWFYGQGLENTITHLDAFFKGTAPWQYWLAYDKERPFAFFITSSIDKPHDDLTKWCNEDGEAITLDILIGDANYLGKGLAHLLIKEFLVSQFSHVSEVLIDPESTNSRAIHVYKKAGFRIVGEFIPKHSPHLHTMMRLNMRQLMDKSMKKTMITMPEIKLVGISVRTSFTLESDKMKGQIFPCVQRYFHEAIFEKIPNRIKPGVTYCIYTDYESDYKGAYTYFIGEAVSSEASLPAGLVSMTIPKQTYAKFTTNPAPMPDVLVKSWGEIWAMSPEELGGKRQYLADFEIYDERAMDHQNIVLDIYVGVTPC